MAYCEICGVSFPSTEDRIEYDGYNFCSFEHFSLWCDDQDKQEKEPEYYEDENLY